MVEAKPSRTAYRVALRRAAHQVFDDPVVFRDPLALRIAGITSGKLALNELRAPKRPYSRSLRAFIVARSCLAEQTMHEAEVQGWTQYVLLGAGLDTFAYRNPYPGVSVFEVDHPATQAWKHGLLRQNGIPVPATCRHVSVDFERDNLCDRLTGAGFQPDRPAVFAWLGVVPYLTGAAMRSTLSTLAAFPAAARLVLDYCLPRDMLPPKEQLALDSLSARVAQAGEPFQQFFSPEGIEQVLANACFRVLQNLGSSDLNARYFENRRDSLSVLGAGARVLLAEKPAGGAMKI